MSGHQPPNAIDPDQPGRARDRPRRATAARIMEVFPRWQVLWGTYTREFWAFPCFGVQPGTVLHAVDANQLAGIIHRLQRSEADKRQ